MPGWRVRRPRRAIRDEPARYTAVTSSSCVEGLSRGACPRGCAIVVAQRGVRAGCGVTGPGTGPPRTRYALPAALFLAVGGIAARLDTSVQCVGCRHRRASRVGCPVRGARPITGEVGGVPRGGSSWGSERPGPPGSGDTSDTAACLLSGSTSRVRRAVVVVNTINWNAANTCAPQDIQDYIATTCAGWVRFPWEVR